MRTLELVKIWSGDGLGPSSAVTLTQLKRTENVALYQRTQKNGMPQGYEVFLIKKRLKGQALPGGQVEQEDRECYPGANSFGKTAWAPGSLAHAEKIYSELVKGKGAVEGDEDDTEETPTVKTPVVLKAVTTTPAVKTIVPLKFPAGEFTHSELATLNGQTNQQVWVRYQQAIKDGVIVLARQDGRTKVWKKA